MVYLYNHSVQNTFNECMGDHHVRAFPVFSHSICAHAQVLLVFTLNIYNHIYISASPFMTSLMHVHLYTKDIILLIFHAPFKIAVYWLNLGMMVTPA